MAHAVESWEDDDSFALPSGDFNPIRISSGSSYSSAGVAAGDEDEDEEDWGVEDFGGRVGAGSFSLGLPKSSGSAPTIGGWDRDGFDEMDDEDDRTDTLKAGQTTIRLPKPNQSASFNSHANRSDDSTPTLGSTPTMTGTVRRLANQSSVSSFVIPPDMDLEDGFSLPTSLSNLNLRPLRSQSSRASFSSVNTSTSASHSTSANSTPTSNSAWGDTPSSSSTSASGGAATGSFSRKSNTASTLHPPQHRSTPSKAGHLQASSIAFSPPSLVRSSSEAGDHPSESSSLDFASEDAGDDLDGIVLSDPLFFTRPNNLRFQSLLDSKRKGNNHPSPAAHPSSGSSRKTGASGDTVRIVSSGGGQADEDMSFEAGLVLDDDVPITMGRLGRVRSKARNKTLPLPKREVGGKVVGRGAGASGGTVPSGRASNKEDWEKDLEREKSGWGRSRSPMPPPSLGRETFAQPEGPSSSSSRLTSTRPRPPQARSATTSSLLGQSGSSTSSPPGAFSPPNNSSLRSAKSHARISTSSLHPSSAAPPSPLPVQAHYPGSHAASLLSRKSSMPMLSSTEPERSSTPTSANGSTSGGRFAAPTAASLARQRGRVVGPDLFLPPGTSSSSPASSSRPSTPNSLFPPSSMATVQPFHQRLTMPTSSSRQKTRSAITPHLFSMGSAPSVTTTAATPSRRSTIPRPPQFAPKPSTKRQYGDGTELDAFEDLLVDREKEGKYRVGPATPTSTRRDTKPLPASAVSPPPNPSSRLGLRAKISSTLTTGTASTDLKRKKPTSSDIPGKSNRPRALKLIQHIGQKTVKVEGKMRYNPKTLKWEGNESALQAFEGLSSSARPLLIAHRTSKSISSQASAHDSTMTPSASLQSNHLPGSPVSAAISLTAKVVGNMWFDPERMKWIHMGGPADEVEEDVFANMSDEDEVEDALSLKLPGSNSGSIAEREEKRSSSRARRIRESGASSASGGGLMNAMDVDDFLRDDDEDENLSASRRTAKQAAFARLCRLAEEGHRAEVAGWGLAGKVSREREEKRLWEIRRVAINTARKEKDRKERSGATA